MHRVQFSTTKIRKRYIHIYKYLEIGTTIINFKYYWAEEKDALEKGTWEISIVWVTFFLPKYYGEHGCLIMYIQVAPNS